MWNFTIALCCWASGTAGEQTTTLQDRQSFPCCWGPSTIWSLAGNSPANCLLIWRTAVMRERQGASHLAWPIKNRGQMNEIQGQSRKQPVLLIIAVHTIYAPQLEEWFPCVCDMFPYVFCASDHGKHYVMTKKIPVPLWPAFFMTLLWSFHLPLCTWGHSIEQQPCSWYGFSLLLTDTAAG